MFEPTGSQRDAASAIFNLPDYRVLDAVVADYGLRRVEVESTGPTRLPGLRGARRTGALPPPATPTRPAGSRSGGAGLGQAPLVLRPGRVSTRNVQRDHRPGAGLRPLHRPAVAGAGGRRRGQRPGASEVARAHRVSRWLVDSMLNAAANLLTDPDDVLVHRLGIDEHRYRSARYFREPDGGWRRYEPWMTTLVDTSSGRVIGVVDGRDSAGVGT
jgi:transposase